MSTPATGVRFGRKSHWVAIAAGVPVVAMACLMLMASASAQEKLLIAHRGASAHAPENTQAAIDVAIGLAADVVELDVQFSRDLVPVVLHDATLQRTTNAAAVFPTRFRVAPNGRRDWHVRDFSVSELRRLDAGAWFSPHFRGARILTLTEALRQIRGRAAVIVDLKVPRDRPFGRVSAGHRIAAAIAAADRRNAADWVSVSSLDYRDLVPTSLGHLAKLKALDLQPDRPPTEFELFPPDVCGVSASRRLLDAYPDIIERARARGRLVLAWGFDSGPGPAPDPLWTALMRYMNDVDVDGIMTNRLEEFTATFPRDTARFSWSICFAGPDGAADATTDASPPIGTDPAVRSARPRN